MAEEQQTGDSPLMSSVERLRKELDHWVDAAWQQGERALDRFGRRAGGLAAAPAADVIESAEDITVLVDVPGISAECVNVELTGHMLVVEGTRAAADVDESTRLHMKERFEGTFRRAIPMPVPVKPDEVTADVRNGVLHVCLPKADVAKSKRIPVKVKEASQPSSDVVAF